MLSRLKKHTLVEGVATGLGLAFLSLSIASFVIFFHWHQDRFYPGVHVEGIDLSGKTKPEALEILTQAPIEVPQFEIIFFVDDIATQTSAKNVGLTKNHSLSLSQAFEVGRAGFPLSRIWKIITLQFNPKNFNSTFALDPEKTKAQLQILAQQVDIQGEEPSATLAFSGSSASLEIFPGLPGRAVDLTGSLISSQKEIGAISPEETKNLKQLEIEVAVASTAAVLDDKAIAAARERAEVYVGNELEFMADNLEFSLNDRDLVALLSFPEGINKPKLSDVITNWAKEINRAPTNAEFDYDPKTLAVSKFVPEENGLKLDFEKALLEVEEFVLDFEEEQVSLATQTETETKSKSPPSSTSSPLLLPIAIDEPTLTLAETNDLGIEGLLGHGDSEYDHSIPNRIYNVSLTSDKINNTIVPPGAEFSFNKTLGEVSARTGFRSAYVIKNGRTILGDGGGVCQVSTTLFRSVLDAGLPITKRRQHSYRVSYYELNAKPGLDATVYSGDVDLRFVNDTGHHLLVNSHADSSKLYMEIDIYGTSDGRSSEITKHEVWGHRSAPAPEYASTPDLPSGVTRQIDWAVGGVKAKVVNVVRDKNGEVIREDEYYSNYVPWSAKYLVGI